VFELRVFQLRDGDVRACVVPADFAVNLDLMAEMSEPVLRPISMRLRYARRMTFDEFMDLEDRSASDDRV
jgi:hypothetical protein